MKTTHNGDYRETALVIVSGLLVFWFIYEIKILLYIALVIGLIGAFVPSVSKLINWAWYKLAEGMGWIMSKVILSVVFFIFLFPIALLSRIFGKRDPLNLKRPSDSTWVERNHGYTGKDLENMW